MTKIFTMLIATTVALSCVIGFMAREMRNGWIVISVSETWEDYPPDYTTTRDEVLEDITEGATAVYPELEGEIEAATNMPGLSDLPKYYGPMRFHEIPADQVVTCEEIMTVLSRICRGAVNQDWRE